MTEKYSLPARLKAARKAAGYKTSKAFIKTHKIPPSTYSQYETGRRTPDEKTLKTYSKLFGISFEWLSTGEGEPYSQSKQDNKKNEILSDEMLDIEGKDLIQKTTPLIGESLLAAILNQMLKIKGLTPQKVAKTTVDIYTDITSIEASKELQIRMVEAAVRTFKRYHSSKQ